MVVTVFWNQSWTSLVMAAVSLVILVLILFFCMCFGRKKKESRFYVIDEKEPRSNNVKKEVTTNSTFSLNIFRRLSSNTEPENIFTSKNLPFYSLKGDNNKYETDLVDSVEATKSFDNLILKFKETDVSSTPRDELRSCASAESLNSFYSAHPSTIAKNSRESFVSLISDCEADNLII